MTDRLMCSVLIDKKLNPLYINLNEVTLKQLNIESNSIILNFGSFKKELTINIDNNLKPNHIKLPSYLNENISIPDLPYDSYFNKNHLFLGPVIGYLVTSRYYKKDELLKLRFSNYNKIKGLIFVFKSKTINQSNKTISGYYYEPTTNKFIRGTFPYPSAIYNRSILNQNIYKHLKEHIGKNIFNYSPGKNSKNYLWNKMSTIPEIVDHLPFTRKYNGVNDLVQMLSKYKSVFLKPSLLSQGRGIFHIKKVDKGYMLSYNTGKKVLIKSIKSFEEIVNSNIKKNGPYIIQQEIPFYQSGKKVDFRVYLQKDGTKNWKYSGMETKVAKVGSVVSNSSYRDKIMQGEVALKDIYHLSEEQIKQKIIEITQLCISVLNIMEKDSKSEVHLGDVAFDLILDKDCKIWLLEVELILYAAESKSNRTIDEHRILPYVLPTPFEYAKSLAGF